MIDGGTEHRKLAAIMFTDMVGYSALSSRDEALALELLEEHRRVLRSVLPSHQGQEIKTMGDGCLIEFASALAAVRCAIEIQESFARRNAVSPPDKCFQLRIGIHVGDVIRRDGDVFGDGVNIAARIEPLAEPGGICISEDVARQVQNKLPQTFVKFGPAELKNIQLPVVVFKMALDAAVPASARTKPEPRQKPSRILIYSLVASVALVVLLLVFLKKEKPQRSMPNETAATKTAKPALDPHRIAVLPLDNLSPTQNDEYSLAGGLTEELTASLSKISGLEVIARDSSERMKKDGNSLSEIGSELRVGTLLGGSVRKAGDQLVVSVHLIDVATLRHLWSQEYDYKELKDVFKMEREVGERVAEALKVKLLGAEVQRLKKEPTANMEAFKLYQMGRYWWNKRTKAGNDKAIESFKHALDLDPNYALAHAGLAACYAIQTEYAGVSAKQAMPMAQAEAAKALELDHNLGEAHSVMAAARDALYDWTGAEDEYRLAIQLSPNFATAHHWFSHHLRTLSRLDDAMVEIRRAEELDPLSPVIKLNIALIFFAKGQTDEAIQQCRKAIEFDPNFPGVHWALGAVYLKKRLFPDALVEIRKVRELAPDFAWGLGLLGHALARSGDKAKALQVLNQLDDLRKKGLAVDTAIAFVHYGLGDIDKTFEFLGRALEAGEHMILISTDPLLEDLRPDPRFQALLRKMNLAK